MLHGVVVIPGWSAVTSFLSAPRRGAALLVAVLCLPGCVPGSDDPTARDPLDFTITSAHEDDCLNRAAVIVDCDGEDAHWRVLRATHQADVPKDLGELRRELLHTGPVVQRHCGDVPGANGIAWVDHFGYGSNHGRDERYRFQIFCLAKMR